MRRGQILLNVAFLVGGVGGVSGALWVEHHWSNNGALIFGGGCVAGVVAFVVFGVILTKLGL